MPITNSNSNEDQLWGILSFSMPRWILTSQKVVFMLLWDFRRGQKLNINLHILLLAKSHYSFVNLGNWSIHQNLDVCTHFQTTNQSESRILNPALLIGWSFENECTFKIWFWSVKNLYNSWSYDQPRTSEANGRNSNKMFIFSMGLW